MKQTTCRASVFLNTESEASLFPRYYYSLGTTLGLKFFRNLSPWPFSVPEPTQIHVKTLHPTRKKREKAKHREREREMEFELEDPLRSFDTIPDLFASESDHMQSQEFLSSFKTSDFHVSFRREAISYILQRSSNMDPFIPYLAINYMNRFISKQDIPQEKPWMLRLLALSCLSIAAKMMGMPSDFMGEEDCCFEAQAINKMELLILDALDWRMRSLTPFPYLYFFLSIFQLKDPPVRQALKLRAIEIIFQAQNDMALFKHKPSIIAASALLTASYELCPLQFPTFKASILSCKYVKKENMMKCFNGMQEMVMEVERCESMLDTLSSTRAPISVLDRGCTHWECQNIKTRSNTDGTENTDIKRQKLNGICFKTMQIRQS